MKQFIFTISLLIAFSFYNHVSAQAIPTATQNEYDADKIKERSKKSHKKADKITKHNAKVQDHASKQAEKNRKEKLSGKKKEDENHEFPR